MQAAPQPPTSPEGSATTAGTAPTSPHPGAQTGAVTQSSWRNKQLQIMTANQAQETLASSGSAVDVENLFSPQPVGDCAQEFPQLTSPVTLPTPTHYMFTPPEQSLNMYRKSLTPTAHVPRNHGGLDLSPLSDGGTTQESIGNSESPTLHSLMLQATARCGGTSPIAGQIGAVTDAQLALAQQQLLMLSGQLPVALRLRQQQQQQHQPQLQQQKPQTPKRKTSGPPTDKRVVSAAERGLLNQVEAVLLDKCANPHRGSVAVVVVQRAVVDKCPEEYEEVVKGHYSGSFHAFLRAHSHIHVFHYDAQTIKDWGLQHCSPHEGRLMYADNPPEEIRRKDQQTCTWKQGESARLLGLLEDIVRREPMPMRLLLDRFRENAEHEGFSPGQIPSNHSVRQTLKKNTERFAITAEAIVKIPEQLTPQERAEWEQKLRAIRVKYGKNQNQDQHQEHHEVQQPVQQQPVQQQPVQQQPVQ
eukprot:Hpha_TRINITY_DN15290_c3_g4::TRINITY_DN15290_c3_g4_i1::g.64713::m.64713